MHDGVSSFLHFLYVQGVSASPHAHVAMLSSSQRHFFQSIIFDYSFSSFKIIYDMKTHPESGHRGRSLPQTTHTVVAVTTFVAVATAFGTPIHVKGLVSLSGQVWVWINPQRVVLFIQVYKFKIPRIKLNFV